MSGPPPVSLLEAARSLEERKYAAEATGQNDFALQGEDTTRRMFVGFDLDLDEVHAISDMAGKAFLHCAIENPEFPVDIAFKSAWVDGLMTGLLLADMRARAEAAHD